MKKRKIKKSTLVPIIGILAVIAIVVGILLFVNHRNSNSYKLQKIGYSKEEVKALLPHKQEMTTILKLEYHEKLTAILKEPYYMMKNLEAYLTYAKEHADKSSSDVVAIINVGANKDWYTDIQTADTGKGFELLVNKFWALPEDYQPEEIVPISNWYAYEGHSIVKEVYDHYKDMWYAAKDAGLELIVTSSYRSYKTQKETYESFEASGGKAYADSYAARPGQSEHETGLALDIVKPGTSDKTFHETEEYRWLLENAHKYGFILRYPEGKEYLTGYAYESWHFRYLGVELATKVKESGLTYDEYYAFYLS